MNYACSFQTVCSALNTLCPFTTIWAHENDSIANIFHLAQYQNNFVSWVEFCLSPHVFFISQKECLITHLHESCCLVAPSHLVAPHWVGQQLLASTRYKESSAPKPGESRTFFFVNNWIGHLLPRHPRSRGSAWSSACAQPKWSLE